jgi:SPP1 gp7 family putative phage head morphogenesis protein
MLESIDIATADDTPRARREKARVRTSTAERNYEAQLRKVAQVVGRITHTLHTEHATYGHITQLLQAYADMLIPWARRTAHRMLEDVDYRSKLMWRSMANEISLGIRQQLEHSHVGLTYSSLMDKQVELIRSLPLDAAERIHRLATKTLVTSARPKEIAEAIEETGEVTKSRAILIARTEVSRAATTFVQARSEAIGSVGYVWETSKDGAVRPSHRAMQGKFVHWSDPPTLDKLTGHAGALPNCRCWPRPVINLE